ncbi:expressed protein [Dictyostelium purpureum]|uniref:Expressed protein n=1 Tax=Dictyostelium purpureum TaxID=5786 RepID=F0Z6R6_DICPU|nr:uncharacterized protein DICPUDRAFT_93399 [Dictyostelium purpureum]EGC40354.1 expressed protein [Dictyostelium purpureum]|eukprot:XP_003283105.1 expressed protein [Dictyostelium purpureum]
MTLAANEILLLKQKKKLTMQTSVTNANEAQKYFSFPIKSAIPSINITTKKKKLVLIIFTGWILNILFQIKKNIKINGTTIKMARKPWKT